MTQAANQAAPIIRTITAVPCGHVNGHPITRQYTYELTREPEMFTERNGRTCVRLWGRDFSSARHGLHRQSPLAVVWEDSIQEV